jgi:hypothetical protein
MSRNHLIVLKSRYKKFSLIIVKNVVTQERLIFLEIQRLQPKDIFGLVNIVFESNEQTANVSLVSHGSECILIDRNFFLNNVSGKFKEVLRKAV